MSSSFTLSSLFHYLYFKEQLRTDMSEYEELIVHMFFSDDKWGWEDHVCQSWRAWSASWFHVHEGLTICYRIAIINILCALLKICAKTRVLICIYQKLKRCALSFLPQLLCLTIWVSVNPQRKLWIKISISLSFQPARVIHHFSFAMII